MSPLLALIGSRKGPVHVPPFPRYLGDPLDRRRGIGAGADAIPEGSHPGSVGPGAPRAGASVVLGRPAGGDGATAPDQPDPGLLFAQTSYARFHDLDPETGQILWTANLGERSGFAAASRPIPGRCSRPMRISSMASTGVPGANSGRSISTPSPPAPRLRRLAGHGGDDQRDDKGHRLQYLDQKGNEHVYDKPVPLWNYHAGTAIRTRPLTAETLVAFGGGDTRSGW